VHKQAILHTDKCQKESMCTYQSQKHSIPALHLCTQAKWQTQFLCPEGLPRKQGNENALCSPDQISNLSDILYDSKPNSPDAEKKKKKKNNLCQVHHRVGLKRSSHFIMEEGSSRVGLPVNVVPRSAFLTLILAILQKKKKWKEMSSPYITTQYTDCS